MILGEITILFYFLQQRRYGGAVLVLNEIYYGENGKK